MSPHSSRFSKTSSPKLVAALLIASGFMAGCSSPSYRCPLSPEDAPDSPTACTSMQEALAGAKASAGGRNSVVTDDYGNLINEVSGATSKKHYAGNPLISRMAIAQSGADSFKSAPAFEAPKVFQFWTPAQVDAHGVFHEGRQSWMATTGRWKAPGADGSGYQPSISAHTQPQGFASSEVSSVSSGYVLRPSIPTDSLSAKFMPAPKEVKPVASPVATPSPAATVPTPAAAAAKKEQKSSALNSFSSSLVNSTQKPSPGITAPAVGLAD